MGGLIGRFSEFGLRLVIFGEIGDFRRSGWCWKISRDRFEIGKFGGEIGDFGVSWPDRVKLAILGFRRLN